MARKKSSSGNKIGSWAFIVGVILALIAGIFPQAAGNTTVTIILVVLGIIVGLLNITGKEAMSYLLASTALVIVAAQGTMNPNIGLFATYYNSILGALLTFVVPATIIVALRAIQALAAD